ncbi:hypothetical protein B296_00004639 [Ensete ventricosum]|uniref:Uncharacterized protein n=1 Tax=Ensete ventricosum TaxID=4639 RepID=A0A427B7A6_ENSVE|nr:hypothetical protein B296_00004639 [Ensete ventricosum]
MEESDVNPTGLIENQNTTKRKREEEIGNRAEVQRGKGRIVPLVARASALLAEEGTEKRRIDVVDHVARVRVSLPPARRYRDQKEAPQGPCLKTNVDGCKPRQLHVSKSEREGIFCGKMGSSTDNLKGFVLALLSSGFIGASFIIKKKGLRRAAAASGVRAGQLFGNSTSSC